MVLCVPLRAAQLFVRCSSLEELGDALERSQPSTVLLALHDGGWATLVGEPDEGLARRLADRFASAMSLALDSSSFSLVVQTWPEGTEERDPQPPHFRDVEAAAWELLDYLGVPASLRLLELRQIELLDEGGVPALLAEGAELSWVAALPPPRSAQLPVAPDVVVASKAGESRALEVRQLPGGIPTDAWAESLADVEQSQALRILRALGAADEPRVPRPAFAYRTLQALRMEKLLGKARRARPWLARLYDPDREPPLSLAGFTQLCRKSLPDVSRAHGPHLELARDGVCFRAPVHEVYELYLTTLDEAAAAAELAKRTLALLDAPLPPQEPRFLLPTLEGARPALLHDDGVRISPAQGGSLERAIGNVDALTAAAPEGFRWLDLEHGRVVVCAFADAGTAGRLLSRDARELILAVLGADAAIAAAPTRDALLACAATDAEGIAWLREESARRFAEGPYPASSLLWVVTAGDLRESES
jgi:hypothetical protein